MAWQLWESTAEVFSERQPARRRRAHRRAFRPRIDSLEARELLATAPLLHIGPDGRHLFDASNQPFYLVGDTAWALPAGATLAQATSYFQTRASQGFNTVLMDADVELGASPVGAPVRGPNDANGNPPLNAFLPGTNLFDVSTPNAAYWQNLDNIINAAAQNGIEIILNTYDNYNPWFGFDSSPNSTAKLTAYGQFLGKRYANFDNIIWMIGNDYGENSGGDASLAAVIQGIRQFDTRHLGFAFDTYGATFDNTSLRQNLQLNTIYEYSPGPWRSLYLSQYNRTDFGPIFNLEAGYENNTSLGVSLADVRNEHYAFLLNGATGDVYGNEDVWPFASNWRDWQAALNSPGAHQMTYFANLLKSIPWSKLIPDQTGTVFTGIGSPTDYSGAYTADGTLALAYKPATGSGSQSFTVNMGRFVGSVTAQWYDPTNGTYTTIGSFANSGSRTFNAPSTNSAGQNDWVLVLRSAVTKPVAPTGLTATAANTQVALSWTVSAGAVSYNIYRSTTSGGEVKIATTPATITTTSYIDTGLSNGTTYYYKVTAVNSAGESARSTEASVTPRLTPPLAPTKLNAAGSNKQVSLSWSAVAGAASYNIYRSTSSGGEIKIATTPATITTTSYTDTGLANGTTYYYKVTAVNAAGESGKSNEASATPSAVAHVQSAAASSDAASATIAKAFTANTVVGNSLVVVVSWDTGGGSGAPTVTDSEGNAFKLATNAADSRHNQALAIFYASAIRGGADTITVNFGANQAYRRLLIHEYRGLLGTVDVTASNISNGAVPTSGSAVTKSAGDLIFAAFMDDSGTTTITAGTGFAQRQSTANDTASEDMIQTSAGAVAATAKFAASMDYLAQMVAFRAAGGTVTVPAAPAGLKASAGNGQVSLSWSASSGATSYRIYRSSSSGGEVKITTTPATITTTSYTDTGLTNGTTYYYKVTAVNSAGESGKSAEVSAKPAAFVLDAAYGFGEGSGTTTTDASGNGNTGTIVGASWTTAGKNGTALSFNGTSNYVDLGNAARFNTADSLSVSAWIKSSSFPSDDAAIVSKRDNTEHGFQLDTTVDRGPRTIGFKLSDANGNLFACYGATTLAANTWYYVTGVYDAVNRTLYVYLNGKLDDGDLVGTVAGSQTPSTRDVQIGQRPGYPGTYNFAGTIDNVRIYGSALSASQIQTDMNTPAGGAVAAPAAPTNLVATASNRQVRLTWTAVAGATSYNVCRSTTPGGEGAMPYRTGVTGTSFTDTGLTNGTHYYYRLAAVNGGGASGRSGEVSALPAASGRSINAGAGATGSFAADALFKGGSNKTTTHPITATGVANAAPQAVYQSARVGSSFNYTVSNLTPGVPYRVRLHFAEIGSVTAARQRVFKVTANGVSLLSNFDIFASGGGKRFVAIVRQFTVKADSLGTIKLVFTGVAGNALLSGLEIVPA